MEKPAKEVIFRKSRFRLFGIEGAFEAFTKGDQWNGWDCPFFTKAEGLKFVDAWNALSEDKAVSERGLARFDMKNDCFEFILSDEVDTIKAEVINGIQLYPIGAFGWCWEECNQGIAMKNELKVGDRVTYADPQDEVERGFIGIVIGHFPDAGPPRTTVRWENSGMKIAPIFTHDPDAWIRINKQEPQ
jgi:hypothetical protein